MRNDSVREELQTKVTTGAILRAQPGEPSPTQEPLAEKLQIKAAPPVRQTTTSELTTARTSPTLVDFQNKNPAIPEWRLQMQNAVQQRIGTTGTAAKMAPSNDLPVNGAAALRVQRSKSADQAHVAEISDPRVASALKRINESRKANLPPAKAWKKTSRNVSAPMKPYSVMTRHDRGTPVKAETNITPPPKKNVLSMPVVTAKRVTTELPKLDPAIEKAFEAKPEPAVIEPRQSVIARAKTTDSPNAEKTQSEFSGVKRIRIKAEAIEIEAVAKEENNHEIEDLAPFSMRFGAGLFDLIIGAFATLLLLSPLAFTGENWWTASSLVVFATVWAIVLFVYMTVTLGFYGKTFGMRLFSLELVDAIENEYPTLRQAAVNSGLFIISLPFVGAGFATVFFNDENRALHDLASGTILVREF